jgi:hypothetical protein
MGLIGLMGLDCGMRSLGVDEIHHDPFADGRGHADHCV